MGKTSVAPKMSTTTTAWWPASHWKTMPWNVKSTIRKAKLPQHKSGSPWQNWYNLADSLFCNAQWQALLKTILNHGSWWLSHSCDSCANGLNNKHSLEQRLWHLASTTSTVVPLRIGKTRVAPKTSKTTTAWWLAWNWDNIIPMAMECQVNDETQSPFKIIPHPATCTVGFAVKIWAQMG